MFRTLVGVVYDGTEDASGYAREPYRQDLEWPRGSAGSVFLQVVGQDGAAVDVTGWQANLTLSLQVEDEAALVVAGSVPDDEDHPADEGWIAFALAVEDTSDLLDGVEYRFDIVALDGDGGTPQLVPLSLWTVASVISEAPTP